MTMIEVKTSELSGAALDWAVAKVEGQQYSRICHFDGDVNATYLETLDYSTDWSQGGPLIDKFCSRLSSNGDRSGPDPETGNHYDDPSPWSACAGFTAGYGQGKTALIAACRAIVAAHLGDTVSVPAELVQS